MDPARQAKRAAADRRAQQHRADAAMAAQDVVRELLDSDLTWLPELRRSVNRLAKHCGGILPAAVRVAWLAFDRELTIAGDMGRIDDAITRPAERFTESLAVEFSLPPMADRKEADHHDERDTGSYSGPGISAGLYFAGATDDRPDELADVEVPQETDAVGPAEAGDSAGDRDVPGVGRDSQ